MPDVLTPAQWEQADKFLADWKKQVLAAARKHPTKGYELGVDQVKQFIGLLGSVGSITAPPETLGPSPTAVAGARWVEHYALHEITGALDAYIDRIRSELLYGLRGGENPLTVASRLYHATQDGEVNWRMIARTEMARANAMGRLDACEAMGYDRVWCPPHIGSCGSCRKLLENRDFSIVDVREATNYGRKEGKWVPCIPLHPHCRHSWLPYDADVVAEARDQYRRMYDAGFTEERLDDMFDSSGQLKPEYADTDMSMFKTHDPFTIGLGIAVEKVTERRVRRPVTRDVRLGELRSDLYQRQPDPLKVSEYAAAADDLPPIDVSERDDGTLWIIDGQHRAFARTKAGQHTTPARVYTGLTWDEENAHCRRAMGEHPTWYGQNSVQKSAPNSVLNSAPDSPWGPPLWQEEGVLTADVRSRLLRWWYTTLGDGIERYSTLFITPAGECRLAINWDQLRKRRPAYSQLATTDLHALFSTIVADRAQDVEVYPGHPLHVLVIPELHPEDVDGIDINLAKAAKAAAPNTGVEHWITVHPHGEAEPGQPVLVRNNADGTMTVIGGAGGHLNYLRLDPKRRIDSKPKGKQDPTKDQLHATENLTEDERQRQEAEHEQRRTEAQDTIDKADAQKQDLHEQLRQYVASGMGLKWLTHKRIRHADGSEEEVELTAGEQRQALRKLVAASVQTLTYGETSKKDANESPYLVEQKHGDFADIKPKDDEKPEETPADEEAAEEPAPGDADPTTAEEDIQHGRDVRARLPALTSEHAEHVLRLERQIARLGRVQAKARKVLREGGDRTSAMALDWTDADIDRDVAKRISEEKRTDFARQLVETAEGNTYRTAQRRALHRGAYDTIDSFSHAVLGVSVVPPHVARLLGPVGTAQLVARAIRRKGDELGSDKVSIDKALGALKELTDRQEAEVAGRALARARTAADTAVQMREERKRSEKGDSLWTQTMARSMEGQKMNEAARQLGMAIGGFEAASALKLALAQGTDTIKVGGFESAGQIRDLANRAGVDVTADNIEKVDSGRYSLNMPAEQLDHLFQQDPPPNGALRKRLQKIRTGKGLDNEIEQARDTPGMSDQLGRAQAQGKLFLLASGSQKRGAARHWNLTGTPIEKRSEDLRALMSLGQVLDFAPGVGKTHTGISAAMQLMHDEPEANHRVLVVCPTTAAPVWAGTVLKQGPQHTAQIVGADFTHTGGGKGTVQSKGKRFREGQYANPCDFNVISYEQLRREPDIAKKLGATIVITDEAQKAKNESSLNWRALEHVAPEGIERPKVPSKTVWRDKYEKLGQEEHITREDKIRQFREGLDENLFHLSANEAGNALPDRLPDKRHKVKLDPEHLDALHQAVGSINDWQAEAREKGQRGPAFGGQDILRKALYDRPGNALARKVADIAAKMKPVEFAGFKDHPTLPDGAHAGTYEPKAVVFSQFVKQLDHVIPELEKKGIKTFYAHGGMTAEQNEKAIADYLAHEGRAVLVTSDKNSTARSFQFGDNNGRFQHGATQMIDYSLPDNNATIQQRHARIHRRGAQVPVQYHSLDAQTPAEVRQQDRLEAERRTQQLSGNSEQLVGGKETLRHLLARAGQKPATEAAAA